MKLKTILVDDEQLARALVKNFISADSDFEVIAEAEDGFSALKLIHEHKPDVVFLDIQMPKLTGLEMLELLEEPPLVVFCTAYDQYAIDAFEKNAIDYLLKPFSKDRFLKTLDKVKSKYHEGLSSKADIDNLIKNAREEEKIIDKVVIKNGAKIEILNLSDISHFEADGDYISIHAKDKKYLKQQTMKQMELQLPADFIRIHRSYLVNGSFIQKLEPYEKNGYQVLLKNGIRLSVSRSGYQELKEKLGW